MIRRATLSFALAALLALSGCAHFTPPGGAAPTAARGGTATGAGSVPAKPLEQLQRDFVELRFGMFIHFGILTYTGKWGQGNLDITRFDPTKLDPGQWADAAAAAKMKYGVLTTRHHDGFALWPSDPAIVKLLREVGAAWTPNLACPPLPAQGLQNEHPYTPVSATASTGNAEDAIDGKNDQMYITMWQPKGALPQSITLDLGQVRPDAGWLGCLPRYYNENSSKDGNVTSYRVLTSPDGSRFSEATAGTWVADGRMKVATFGPTATRYLRFEILAANGSPAVTEITVGGRR